METGCRAARAAFSCPRPGGSAASCVRSGMRPCGMWTVAFGCFCDLDHLDLIVRRNTKPRITIPTPTNTSGTVPAFENRATAATINPAAMKITAPPIDSSVAGCPPCQEAMVQQFQSTLNHAEQRKAQCRAKPRVRALVRNSARTHLHTATSRSDTAARLEGPPIVLAASPRSRDHAPLPDERDERSCDHFATKNPWRGPARACEGRKTLARPPSPFLMFCREKRRGAARL